MTQPKTTRIGDTYLYSWPAPDHVEIEIDQVRRKADDWLGWVTVRTRAPGMDPHLAEAQHNLGSIQSRTTLAKHLSTRMEGVDWPAFLEMACILTVRAEKDGDPFVTAGSMKPEAQQPFWLVEPLIRTGLPTILYGDGGAGKSTTALMVAATLLCGLPIAGFTPTYTATVLYLDWETEQGEIDDSLKKLRAGHELDIPDIYYRRETWPLQQSARQIKKFIDEKGVLLTVVDSIGAALGGEPESAEVVLRFFQAVRSLGVATLCVDHITKAGSQGKPFGSVYKHNAARLTFELRRHQLPEDDIMHLGLYHTKANKGIIQRPIGLRVDFGNEAIQFSREEIPADATELVAGLSASERIRRALIEARAALNASEIMERTGLDEKILRPRLSHMVKAGKLGKFEAVGVGAAAKYYLPSYRDEAVGP